MHTVLPDSGLFAAIANQNPFDDAACQAGPRIFIPATALQGRAFLLAVLDPLFARRPRFLPRRRHQGHQRRAPGVRRNRPLKRMVRDACMFTIGGGTARILRTVVASRILGRKLSQTREDGYLNDERGKSRRNF